MAALLTVREMAKFLQIDEQTLYRKVEKGLIPCLRIDGPKGGQIRFDLDQVKEFMQQRVEDRKGRA
jgi:excisionase family DNA binding protein